jgi:protein-S-isoprenylcysteine O-methyltransferase Ste14
MDTQKRALIFNGFGVLASLFILLSGAIVSQVLIYLLVQIFGALLMIWAFITIKVHKTHQNLPKGYFFLKTGPYEIIRHPIYASYLLIMVSFVEIEFTLLRLIALLILVAAIFMKILREEDLLNRTISEYSEYKKKTKAIIPYLL